MVRFALPTALDSRADWETIRLMGRVTVKLKLTNQADLVLKRHKVIKRAPRRVEIDALADTGATRLYLKPSVIRALGLTKASQVTTRTANGDRVRNVYSPVHLELMERDGNFDVVDIDEDLPNLLGQIPLEYLDLTVDPKTQLLRPNPAHGDKLIVETY